MISIGKHMIYKKEIYRYDLSRLDEDVLCDAIAIRELCKSGDSCDALMFDLTELHIFKPYVHYQFRIIMS